MHAEAVEDVLGEGPGEPPGEDEGEVIDVRAGELLTIPSNVPHKAEALEDTLDLDVFNPPREDWLNKTDAYLREAQK